MRGVVVTGMGVVSALGDSPAAVHAALARDDACDAPGRPIAGFAAEAYLGQRNLRPLDRPAQLLAAAAQLALADSGWTSGRIADAEVGLVVGTVFSTIRTIAEFDRRAVSEGASYASPLDFANTVINAPAGQTAIWHGLRGVNVTVAAGAASGLSAIAHAADLIRAGRVSVVLSGGVEEMSPESTSGFRGGALLSAGERPRPFDANRRGFALGEGAALLVLEGADVAAARGARVLARVAGSGARFDPGRGAEDGPAVTAAAGALRLALNDAGLTHADVQCVSASARGDIAGDRREAAALGVVFAGRGDDLAVTAVKARLGEALGAAGALQAVALVEGMRIGSVPGIPGLERVVDPFLVGKANRQTVRRDVRVGVVNSVGFDGHCCSVVLTAC